MLTQQRRKITVVQHRLYGFGRQGIRDILRDGSAQAALLSNLPPRQKTVLQAIAKEGKARMITSQQFIKKYNLGSASSIQSAVKLLLKSDLITQTDGVYRVYDFFFSRWLAIFY